MVQYKKIGVIALILAFVASLGVNVDNYVNDEGIVIDEGYLPYACAKETVSDMYCYKLSKIGTTGVNRNCYYDRERGRKYKVCSTGWERIQVIGEDCPKVTCEDNQKECPYVTPCEVCKEPEPCPDYGGGAGGGSSCPSCSDDGKTVCTEIIGFVVTEDEKWYCRNCGSDGCEDCISNEDIDLDLDLFPLE